MYCILQHSNKKKCSVFFLKPPGAVSVFLDLEIVSFLLSVLLSCVNINTVLHVATKARGFLLVNLTCYN